MKKKKQKEKKIELKIKKRECVRMWEGEGEIEPLYRR